MTGTEKEHQNKKDNRKVLRRVISSHAKFKWRVLTVMLFVIGANVCWSLGPYVIVKITNELSGEADLGHIGWLLLAFAMCLLLSLIFDRARWIYEVKKVDYKISDSIAESTMDHLKRLTIGQHKDEHSIVTSSKVTTGENAVTNFFDTVVYSLLPMLISASIAIVMMLCVVPIVGLAALVCSVGVVLSAMKISNKYNGPIKRLSKFGHRVVGKTRGEFIRHIDSMILANEEDRYARRHMRNRKYRVDMFQMIYIPFGKMFVFMMFWANFGRFLTIAITAYMIYAGHYQIGAIAAVFAWSNQSLGQLQHLQGMYRRMTEDWADIVQYFEIMDVEPDIKQSESAFKFPEIKGEIVFDGVFFTYNGADDHALANVSLRIEPGQKVGIVGPSGAGKSTLLAMLQLAYLPQLGSVRVDGIDLAAVNHDSYRDCVGFVEQHPQLFSYSLRENLKFGLSSYRRNEVTDEDLVEVLRNVGLERLASRLSEKIGEFGNKLSGGQRQRVAIARILLKKPDLLIVDEATSAVDPANEKIVHDSLENVSPGATRIFVAHRLSTVQDSDVIFVMDQGKIVGKGTHSSLLDDCRIYQDLVQNLLLRT